MTGQDAHAARARAVECGIEDLLQGDPGEAVLLARLAPLARMATMYAEMLNRIATARDFGIRVASANRPAIDAKDCKILVVAETDGLIDTLRPALEAGEYSVEFESDAYLAADRIEGERFDATLVLIGRGMDTERPFYFCSHIRNNPRLFNLPVLVVAEEGTFADEMEAYDVGASSVMTAPVESDTLAALLAILVRRQRLRWGLRNPIVATLQGSAKAPFDGVYSGEFLIKHLGRLIPLTQAKNKTLAVVCFSIDSAPDLAEQFGAGAQRLILQQMADWISGLLRVEDLTARTGPIEFSALLPDTAEAEAQTVMRRITGILHHSDFHLTEEVTEPIHVRVVAGCANLTPDDESAEDLIARARDGA
jgi:two-component system cell cycle response regulator